MNTQNKRKKGFTLIELLVVITIIGILAGIAFVSFGDVFGTAGRTTAQKNLTTVYDTLAANNQLRFPFQDDVKSVADFAVWFRNKTNDTRTEIWFISEDEKVKNLSENDGPGVPANIPEESGDMDAKQKAALGYCIAIPGQNAETASYVKNLKSGAFPIMWTRGLEPGSSTWSADSPWGGEGGHVLFSDKTVRWFDNTKGEDENGVFLSAVNKSDGDKKATATHDIQAALPKGWVILKPQ